MLMAANTTSPDWKNLADHLNERRLDLNKSWKDVEVEVQLSGTMLRRIRNGGAKSVSDDTAFKLERAMQWERGSVQLALEGKDPIPKESARPAPSPAEAASVEPAAAGSSPPATTQTEAPSDVDLELFDRWRRYVGHTFTRDAFWELVADFKRVRDAAVSEVRQQSPR